MWRQTLRRGVKNMDHEKRDFLSAIASAAVAASGALFARGAFGRQMGRRPGPPDMQPDPMNQPPPFDPKKIQERNQKTIVQDIQKLYKLAGELKDEIEKTDSTTTLSLPMIQKAKEVEKLAKQIASLAAG
jgi:hypothetical protein